MEYLDFARACFDTHMRPFAGYLKTMLSLLELNMEKIKTEENNHIIL